MSQNVASLISSENKCIGCGVCVNFCPAKVLQMKMNDEKIYEVMASDGCIEKCDICLKICPFFDANEDDINAEIYVNLPNFNEYFRAYLSTYEFCKKDDNERISSASGGAGNFIITKLFELDMIDYAICPIGDERELFSFQVLSKNEAFKIKGSVYYPLNLENAIKFIIQNNARFAITALPCFAKALRLAMKRSARLKNRLKFIIGLVCGQNKSANYTQKLANLAFQNENTQLKSVNFRYKFKDKNAMQFGIKFTDIHDKIAIDDRTKSAFLWWGSRAFTPFACNSCNDVFAKCADAVLMDAWLEEKIGDFRGESLVVLRDEDLENIFKNCDQNCKIIDEKKVILSQMGVIRSKNLIKFGSYNLIKSKIRKLKLNIQKESLSNFNCDEYVKIKSKQIEKLDKIDNQFETLKYRFKNYTKKIHV